jgi:integrase
MTSPSHGGGRRFESGRAHLFSSDFNEETVSAELLKSCCELSTFGEKLSTLRQTSVAPSLATLALDFKIDELCSYTEARLTGLAPKSVDWIKRASRIFWRATHGTITKQSMDHLRSYVLEKYRSTWSKSKILAFAKAFLTYLTKTRLDTRFQAFSIFLDLPKGVKERKNVTNRIVTKEDLEHVLGHIRSAESRGKISKERAAQYTAFTVFGALTGQRSMATMMKLTVGQLREALRAPKPVLRVEPHQDKIRMAHYVPLHPEVVEAVRPLLDERRDDELMFQHGSFWMWVKRQKIPMSQFKGNFVLGDLRKFTEQHGDIIQWDQSNRAYIMTHDVSGIDWKHYKHPLPENVYDVYMQYWGDIALKDSS